MNGTSIYHGVCAIFIAGIDRILDMGRTVVNIIGDANCAVCISKAEDRKLAKAATKLSNLQEVGVS